MHRLNRALVKALANEDDWKLVYAAALSLARLKANGASDSLRSVRNLHWYPPVRRVAASAIGHIESGSRLSEPEWWQHGAIEGGPKTCRAVREKAVVESSSQKLIKTRDRKELKQLSYGSEIRSYGPPEGTKPNKHGVIEVTGDNMVEHVKQISQVPDVALKIPDGWLVGSDRGEWGGELVHVSAARREQRSPGNERRKHLSR